MTVSVQQIWDGLQQLGLATPAECGELAGQAAAAVGPQALTDPNKLVDFLTVNHHISPYLVRQIESSDLLSAKVGPFVLWEPMSQSPLSRWFRARNGSQEVWLTQIDLDAQLNQPAANPPSMNLLNAQVATATPNRANVAYQIDGRLLIITLPPLAGKPLSAALGKRPLSLPQMWNIAEPILQALADMHSANLVHGSLSTERVWCQSETEFVLLSDPVYPPTPPTAPRVSVFDSDQNTSLNYAAPEFLVPGHHPTQQTDVYAAACWLFQLSTGRPPFNLPSDEQLAAHATQPVPVDQLSDWSDEQKQVLNFALAKNVEDRLLNAAQLLTALRASMPQSAPAATPDKTVQSTAAIQPVTRQSAPEKSKDERAPTAKVPIAKEPAEESPAGKPASARTHLDPQKKIQKPVPSTKPAAKAKPPGDTDPLRNDASKPSPEVKTKPDASGSSKPPRSQSQANRRPVDTSRQFPNRNRKADRRRPFQPWIRRSQRSPRRQTLGPNLPCKNHHPLPPVTNRRAMIPPRVQPANHAPRPTLQRAIRLLQRLNRTSRPPRKANPKKANPIGLNPTGLNPTGLNPTGLNPTGLNHARQKRTDANRPRPSCWALHRYRPVPFASDARRRTRNPLGCCPPSLPPASWGWVD
jgi:serine/threonine protein kinase